MSNKYIIAYLLLVILGIPFSASADKFYIEPANLGAGETETLRFVLENSQEYFGFQAEVKLPKGIQALKDSEGKLEITLSDRSEGGDYDVNSNILEGDALIMAVFSTNHKPFSGTDGLLVNLKVSVDSDFTGGTVEISNIKFINSQDKDVVFSSTSAYLGLKETGIELNKTELALYEGNSESLTATITPQNATDKSVSWLSSDTGVATVSEDGKVTAVKAGTATITATSASGLTATCKVMVSVEVKGISLNKTELSLYEGNTESLTATISPENATDKTVTWTSSDTGIATVSADGKVTAVKAGTATITATSSNGLTATCKVTVNVEVKGISLNKAELSLYEGSSETLTATVTPENATDKSVTWTSSDIGVATVSSDGKVTAVKAGTAIITATSSNGLTATCKVTVSIEVKGISLNKTELSLYEGNTESLTATISPENATDKTVTWTSSDTGVATVSADGKVTAVKAGTATITVTTVNGLAASCRVTVNAEVTGVSLSKTGLSLYEGNSETLTATVTPENATDKSVTWSSSDTGVATVSSDGKVTAVKTGSATITAKTTNGKTATCDVTVLPILVETLTIDPTEWSGEEGNEFKITATVSPDNASDKTLAFKSSDTSIATVDKDGNVKVLKEGSCTISVSTTDGSSLSAECVISVLSGIDAVFTEDAVVDVYSMDGVLLKRNCRVEELKLLKPTMYILRKGNKSLKIILR